MAQRKISAYWLILVAVVLAVTLALSVGTALARYVCTDQWNTLVNMKPPVNQILVLDGTQVIDLGQLPLGSTAVQFALNGETTEKVTCSTAEGITAQLENADGVYTLTLRMEAYPAASGEIRIPVMAGEETLGTFRISLPGTEAAQAGEADASEGNGDVSSDETIEDTTGENTEGTTGETTEGTTGETEPVEYLQATAWVLTDEYLEVSLGMSSAADRVAITLGDGFPKGTRYSTDGGNTWNLLYFGGSIWLDAQTELNVAVDVSQAEAPVLGSKSLKAESYTGLALQNTLTGDVYYGTVTLTTSAILTAPEDTLEVSLPQCPEGYKPESTIEILTTDAEGDLIYTDATAAFEVTVDDTYTLLTVRFAEQLPQAGTYRLNLTWTNGETLTNQSLTPFFISYSDANTGGAE